MSAISERVAAQHVLYRCTEDGGTGVYGQPLAVYVGYQCECGWDTTDSNATSQHVADVTEKAVREAIAGELEKLVDDPPRAPLTHAARIAREGTAP